MTCHAFRIGAAAIVGYSIGALISGGTTIAWALAAAAAVGMYVWSRIGPGRANRACSSGCAMPRRGWRGRFVGAPSDVEVPRDAELHFVRRTEAGTEAGTEDSTEDSTDANGVVVPAGAGELGQHEMAGRPKEG